METATNTNLFDRKLIERIVNITGVITLTAVVLKYTMPVVSDLIYSRE